MNKRAKTVLKLFNTLSRQLEDFRPISSSLVKLYTCGPTVYDYAQLGNWRSFIFDDTLRRTLQINNYKVKHVMNITDVGHLVSDMDEGEDKLEKGAQREGKSVWQVAKFFTAKFIADAKLLNILEPNGYKGATGHYAMATDFIPQQLEIIELLLDKGFAYQTPEAIYFDVSKLPEYGVLAGQRLAEKEEGVREEVVTDANKHHPQDFALWFFLVGRFAHHSMHWDSPWGPGFPGWHLECSAIIHATLGEPIDIHTGGVDHIGTHHPNEIAQTKAAYGKKLANYWLHNEFLLVNGQKMAKSQGNFYTLEDVIKKGYEPLALRLLFLQAHYRSQQNFTWAALDAAAAYLRRLQAWADLRHQPSAKTMPDELDNLFKLTKEKMLERMNDDLDSPGALAALSELVSYMQDIPIPGVNGKQTDGILKFIDDMLGLGLSQRPDITDWQKQLIRDRETARKNNDWAKADELRQRLLEASIEINDTPYGPVWSRI